MKKKILAGISIALAGILGIISAPVGADSLPAIDFESSTYTTGNINGQNGWSKTGSYDVEVASVGTFSNASGFGFGAQALRLSNAVTSGAFGDQTFSPGLSDPASESSATNRFEATFEIGSTQDVQQPGLFTSVSPDDGNGSRMSYVGFDDQADGIHVIFYDVTNPGPLPTVATFNSTDVTTIDRTSSHSVKFVIDLLPGPANDVVKLYVDGSLEITGTTWEDYYRYDPEQTGNGNVVPSISKLLFREGGTAVSANAGKGYLVDGVSLLSGPIPTPTPDPFAPPQQCENMEFSGVPIIGTSGSEVINGTNGNDLIFALGGSDKVDGKGGADCIVGGDGSDKLIGGNGEDVIIGGAGSDSIEGNNQADSLYGEEGSDSLKGGNQNDELFGGDDSDSLKGENGNDSLDGGNGSDSANGGNGNNDTCTAESEKQCEL